MASTVLDRSYEVKANLLLASGYCYDVQRISYVNRELRKVFSAEFLDDHGEDVIRRNMTEPASPAGRWQFYFNNAPSEAAWHLVEEEYAKSWLKR